jgi:hypothetical protein
MTDNPDLWGGELPGELAHEMRADDNWVFMLWSTASEAVTRGKNRVRVELAHVKAPVAALVEAATEVGEYLQGQWTAWVEGLVKGAATASTWPAPWASSL